MSNLEDKVMTPILRTSRAFYIFMIALLIVASVGVYAYTVQLSGGMAVTGLDDIHIWGIYISNFIFFIGVSHAGIAISATVHIMDLHAYRPIARMAELLTLVSLAMAGLSIVIDLGRPDRSFYLIIYYLQRFPTSPLIWDITAVATYLVLSTTYLYLSLREDIGKCMNRCTGVRRSLYKLMLPLHTEGEQSTIRRISWWMAITILPVMVMVHTTVAWIFAVMSSRPLWFSAFAGPFYIVAAIASGIGSVVVIAVLLRRIYHWEELISPKVIRAMGVFLSVVTLIYLYFMLGEQLASQYAGPTADFLVSQSWIFGDYAWIFWPMTIIGMFLPAMTLIAQSIRKAPTNVALTGFLALVVVIAFWVKRYLLIASTMPRGITVSIYDPTWVEFAVVAATFAIPTLLYCVFLKLFPIIELGVAHDMEREGAQA